jgi:hypothetical protein
VYLQAGTLQSSYRGFGIYLINWVRVHLGGEKGDGGGGLLLLPPHPFLTASLPSYPTVYIMTDDVTADSPFSSMMP